MSLLTVFINGLRLPESTDAIALIVPVPIIFTYPFLFILNVIKSEVFVDGGLLTTPNLIVIDSPVFAENGWSGFCLLVTFCPLTTAEGSK